MGQYMSLNIESRVDNGAGGLVFYVGGAAVGRGSPVGVVARAYASAHMVLLETRILI